MPWAWKTNTTIPQNLEVFSYCTSQSKASTSPPKQQPGYKFHIHVGQFKVIKCPTLGKLQSLCDLSQSTTCEATTFPFEIIHSPFVLLQAPRHTGIMWLGRGRGWAYGVDAFLSSPEQAYNNIFISYIKYTNITPPANSKANRGRWCVDGLRFITNSWSEKVPYL